MTFISNLKKIIKHESTIKIVLITIGTLTVLSLAYTGAYYNRILPRVHVGTVSVGGLTREKAIIKLDNHFDDIKLDGIKITINGKSEIIRLENINGDLLASDTARKAWLIGRKESIFSRIKTRLASIFRTKIITAEIDTNDSLLENEISSIAKIHDNPKKDVRLNINETTVAIKYDTKEGKIIAQKKLHDNIKKSLESLDAREITVTILNDIPSANPKSAPEAQKIAEKIMQNSLNLVYQGRIFSISRKMIGSWIISKYSQDSLIAGLNQKAISTYVSEIAQNINTAPQDITVRVQDNKVLGFAPPVPGKELEENEAITLITKALNERHEDGRITKTISLPVAIKTPTVLVGETSESLGVIELIGEATTPFTGSPKNRVHNITNGTKFLSGLLIKPGEEFSTVMSLGEIDNTTGYLPELVIKGDETVPEFGGGLCQVSTTLFRAVMNAGLPVTARQNHSYRVSYYEYDGDKNYIGAGLDATIYQPNPDFKFRNNMDSSILIQGFVNGDKITFKLYGTKDGRSSEIDGPHTLTETPAPEPIYTETDTLPTGETKKIESAHSGGKAVATYTITYPNEETEEQEFISYYRPWPEKWLVGTGENTEVWKF